MKNSRLSDSQIMEVLKRADVGVKVPDLCRELGVSSATFYRWRAKFGSMDVSMMSRMKALEEENRRLKKTYLEASSKPRLFRRHLTLVQKCQYRSESQAGLSDLP